MALLGPMVVVAETPAAELLDVLAVGDDCAGVAVDVPGHRECEQVVERARLVRGG